MQETLAGGFVMLDDLEFIAKYDKANALAIIGGQPAQLSQEYQIDHLPKGKIANIVLAGMGGSALAAELVHSWLADTLEVPMSISRGYNLPAFVNNETLLICSSYSGNTEETLAALAQGKQMGAKIVILTSGGHLNEIAEQNHYALLETPTGLQPRLAVLYGVRALVQLFDALGLATKATDEVVSAGLWLEGHITGWMAKNPEDQNAAKQIATAIFGSPVVVYGGPVLAMPTMKWKIDLNENAKNLAFYNVLPEFDHNEFQGWLFPPQKQIKVVELHSSLDNPRINKRFEVSNRLLSGHMPEPIIVQAQGETVLQQILWTLLLGDYVSAYVAFLNGVDPTPVELVEKLKQELG